MDGYLVGFDDREQEDRKIIRGRKRVMDSIGLQAWPDFLLACTPINSTQIGG